MPVTNCDTIVRRLKELHDTQLLSWQEIADRDDYRGIPRGTLCSIAHGKPVPKKWRKQLGLPELAPAPVCVSCGSVHAGNCNPARQMVDISAVPVEQRKFILRDMYPKKKG